MPCPVNGPKKSAASPTSSPPATQGRSAHCPNGPVPSPPPPNSPGPTPPPPPPAPRPGGGPPPPGPGGHRPPARGGGRGGRVRSGGGEGEKLSPPARRPHIPAPLGATTFTPYTLAWGVRSTASSTPSSR